VFPSSPDHSPGTVVSIPDPSYRAGLLTALPGVRVFPGTDCPRCGWPAGSGQGCVAHRRGSQLAIYPGNCGAGHVGVDPHRWDLLDAPPARRAIHGVRAVAHEHSVGRDLVARVHVPFTLRPRWREYVDCHALKLARSGGFGAPTGCTCLRCGWPVGSVGCAVNCGPRPTGRRGDRLSG
jgi:hypothetical protein